MNNIGDLVKAYLNYNNLSLRKFTEYAENKNKNKNNNYTVAHSTIDNIIRNKSKTSIETFDYLANALEITTEDLLLLSRYGTYKRIEKSTFIKLSNILRIPYDELLEIAGYTEERLENAIKEPIDIITFMYENDIIINDEILNFREKEFIMQSVINTHDMIRSIKTLKK